jgi:hypothetical protein
METLEPFYAFCHKSSYNLNPFSSVKNYLLIVYLLINLAKFYFN